MCLARCGEVGSVFGRSPPKHSAKAALHDPVDSNVIPDASQTRPKQTDSAIQSSETASSQGAYKQTTPWLLSAIKAPRFLGATGELIGFREHAGGNVLAKTRFVKTQFSGTQALERHIAVRMCAPQSSLKMCSVRKEAGLRLPQCRKADGKQRTKL